MEQNKTKKFLDLVFVVLLELYLIFLVNGGLVSWFLPYLLLLIQVLTVHGPSCLTSVFLQGTGVSNLV